MRNMSKDNIEKSLMKIKGQWKGVLYIEKLRPFVRDEEFGILIYSAEPKGELKAYITEEVQPLGLSQADSNNRLITYQASGCIDLSNNQLWMKGQRPTRKLDKEDITIKGTWDPIKKTIFGLYFFNGETVNIELYKSL